MPRSKPAVFGIYTARPQVEQAVEMLRSENFAKGDISIFLPHKDTLGKLAHVADTRAVEGAEMGMTVGAIIGSVLGCLAGVGMLAVPGIGAVIVAGPLATMLITTGAAAGVGGLWGGLIGLGIPEKEATHFQSRIHAGDILLSVHCADAEKIIRAKEIMIHTGAEDVYSRHPSRTQRHCNFDYRTNSNQGANHVIDP
jgi:hypothetical protein